MKKKNHFALLSTVPLIALAGCLIQERVSYQSDVVPIVENKCITCHMPPGGRGYMESGLDMRSYASLMEGTPFGPVIVRGDSLHSILNMVVEGRVDSSIRKLHPLPAEDVETLSLWVDQGAMKD